MMNNREIGKLCENSVCRFLEKNGFNIACVNFRYGRGKEIDIIALKNNTYHFVEVKARSGQAFGSPAEAVGARKKANIRTASEIFCMKNDIYDKPRSYDIAEVFFQRTEDGIKISCINMIFSAY